MDLLSYLLIMASVATSIPVGVLLLQVVAASVRPKRRPSPVAEGGLKSSLAVLIPAHNEGIGLIPTLDDIKGQLRTGDRFIVVADNCTDDTAVVAAAAGAEVVARNDLERVGKGYALDWGLQYLTSDPPDVVIVVDADCRLEEQAVNRLVAACVQTHRPVQALYLMIRPDPDAASQQVAEFAWRVKNWVRPLGLRALNLPCQLMGTGMAFPWDVIRSAELASGHLVEDLKLGLDLAMSGYPPVFCASAVVTSQFPSGSEGAISQRYRWEHGHLRTILTAPRLVYLGLVHRNFDIIALALDLVVPPLSFLGLLVVGMLVSTGAGMLLGTSSIALIISAANLLGLLLAVLLAWGSYGRDVLSPRAVFSVISYVLAKIPLYLSAFSRRRASQWIRTDRKK